MDTAVAAAVDDVFREEKRERSLSDMGELLHSPSAALMTLVDCDHLNDFDAVCKYLSSNAMEVGEHIHTCSSNFAAVCDAAVHGKTLYYSS